MTNNRFSSFPIFFTCFALLVFAKPLSAVEGEVVIADIKPGKMELRAVFVNQFEGRMNWVFRGKLKPQTKSLPKG